VLPGWAPPCFDAAQLVYQTIRRGEGSRDRHRTRTPISHEEALHGAQTALGTWAWADGGGMASHARAGLPVTVYDARPRGHRGLARRAPPAGSRQRRWRPPPTSYLEPAKPALRRSVGARPEASWRGCGRDSLHRHARLAPARRRRSARRWRRRAARCWPWPWGGPVRGPRATSRDGGGDPKVVESGGGILDRWARLASTAAAGLRRLTKVVNNLVSCSIAAMWARAMASG